MAKSSKKSLNVPPFPKLARDAYSWTGKLILKSWKGFQARGGPYGAVSSKKGSDGSAHLMINPPDDNGSPPTEEQASAYEHLRDNEKKIRDAVVDAIFKNYPHMRACCGLDDEKAERLAPVIKKPGQLKSLIGLSTVHILTAAKAGVAYVGFEFGCTWESEHGLGVMTHKGRVVEVGHADTSFLEWIAQKDAKPPKKKAKKPKKKK